MEPCAGRKRLFEGDACSTCSPSAKRLQTSPRGSLRVPSNPFGCTWAADHASAQQPGSPRLPLAALHPLQPLQPLTPHSAAASLKSMRKRGLEEDNSWRSPSKLHKSGSSGSVHPALASVELLPPGLSSPQPADDDMDACAAPASPSHQPHQVRCRGPHSMRNSCRPPRPAC